MQLVRRHSTLPTVRLSILVRSEVCNAGSTSRYTARHSVRFRTLEGRTQSPQNRGNSYFKSYKYPRLEHQCRTKNIYQHYCENPETSSKTKCIMYWGKVSACANLSQGLFPDNAPSSIFSAFWQHFSHPCNSTLPKQIFPASQTQVEKAGREEGDKEERSCCSSCCASWTPRR